MALEIYKIDVFEFKIVYKIMCSYFKNNLSFSQIDIFGKKLNALKLPKLK